MAIKSRLCRFFCGSWRLFNRTFEVLTPIGDLIIRYWLAKIFFMSALTKIASWDTTLMLFKYEYAVPLIPSDCAAYLGTAAELVLPILLLLGIGGRLPAFMLFIFNLFAVISYPFLLTAAGYAGLMAHFYWGMLLMVVLLHGTGKLSVDYLISWWLHRRPGI